MNKQNSMATLTAFVMAMLLLHHPAIAGGADPAFRWPGDARAAVSLAYDDALDSQLDIALPALNRAGLKGSFYLTLSNPSVAGRLQAWRAAAAQGHELGNHTLFHHCSRSRPGRDWVPQHRNLDTLSVAQLQDQIILANAMLHAIDGQTRRTFTTPCGDLQAGGHDYLDAIKSEFVGIKSRAGSGITASMTGLDPYDVVVHAAEGLSGKQLIDMVKAAAAQGTMVNFTFHGIGGDYLTTSQEAHAELLAYLADNRKTLWTDTFLNIMTHVRARQATAP
jgi:peptidoglycan/xylan/chitin deacetylase (PgdA/CDA1 family)